MNIQKFRDNYKIPEFLKITVPSNSYLVRIKKKQLKYLNTSFASLQGFLEIAQNLFFE